MGLTNGTRLGSYEVITALGAGGMGEVYRARDTKLGRSVAVKVLPDALASDVDRIARFEREAKALAALNHPHIAALYGMEESDGRHFLVMELVEGETLAERLQRGAMPIGDALTTALQIADALEAAHEKGIVHRDLKPANVKITPDEKVKVLDFGLAKALETERGVSELTHSPTLSLMATEAGLILGTAAYMSPEQAKGFPADHRSDVFSFGVVLYEMLTGRQPFQGETAPDIMASVLVRDPDLKSLPPNLNPRLYELLRRCLEKQPKRRWQAIGDVRAEIETIAADPHGASTIAQAAAPPRPLWRRAIPVLLAAIAASALTGIVVWSLRPSAAPPTVTRFRFTLPENQTFTNAGRLLVVISPDGTRIVYVAERRLYSRSLSELEARPIPGTDTTEGIVNPTFSPDGQSVAFWSAADQSLKRIAVTGGVALSICAATRPYGVSWDPSGILFAQGGIGILRVSPSGGQPEVLIKVDGRDAAYGPEFLPGGQAILFTLASASGGLDRWDRGQIVVQSLTTGERKVLVDGGSDGHYLTSGHLVYANGGVLFAKPFDVRRLATQGTAVPILEGVRRSDGGQTGVAHFSVSKTGSMVYLPGPTFSSAVQGDIAFIDRKGTIEKLKIPSSSFEAVRVSPDGTQLALGLDDGKGSNIWMYELTGATSPRQLTLAGRNRFPVWAPDSQRVAFQSDREGDLGIFWQRADGSDTAQRLTKADSGTAHTPESWNRTDDVFSFTVFSGSKYSRWTFSMRDKKATLVSNEQSTFPTNSVFSPDGRWLAYCQIDLGNSIWVEPYPATGAKYPIRKGGMHPMWSPDGQTLFFAAPGLFFGVPITTRGGFKFGPPESLPRPFQAPGPSAARSFDILPDGRIVGIVAAGTSAGTPKDVEVVLNWFEDLKQRVPLER